MSRYLRRRYRSFDDHEEDEVASDRHKFDWFGNNRHLCDVLEDMRRCEKTKNYSALAGLIEEAQVMGYRMESALGDRKDLIKLQKEFSAARNAYKKLEKEYTDLCKKVDAKKAKLPKPKSSK